LPKTDSGDLPGKIDLARVAPRLKRALPLFRKLHVAVVGDVMLDRYLWGTAHRLSPEAAVPVVDLVEQKDFPGGAGNVAANIAALGAHVQVFAVIGGQTRPKAAADDEPGAVLRASLRRSAINDRGVVADPQRTTTVKTRIIARQQQLVRIDHERRDALAPATEQKLFRLLLHSLKSVDALLISDYDKGLIPSSFAERILNAAHKFNVPVFVKPNSSRLFVYRGARTVVCNTSEAALYIGSALTDEKTLEEAGRALLAHFGSASLVITRREKGMSIFEEASPRYLNIPATSFEVTYARVGQRGLEREASGRQVFDVTGAGDTVLSVLSLAMAAGLPLADAALLANTAAGMVVRKLGTATVSPAELAAALDEIHV
jgi:D-beta-D-heptose 7-phosphate kinase / D-beta-D-heptose 1-phosphate adenosyltransferase